MKMDHIKRLSAIGTVGAGLLLLVSTTYAQQDPRANRDTLTARDRVAAFCDPADYPRELRGETLDCSGFEPTNAPPEPTQPGQPTQPTATPRVGEPEDPGVLTSTPSPSDNGNGGDDDDDPCAPGNTYTGEYCGWSPGVGEGGDGESAEGSRIGEPGGPIKGLSYTSGSDLAASDIILLTGVLCLLLYVRSKFLGGSAKLSSGKRRLRNY